MKYKVAIAQGRFHIVHYGHVEYLIESKKRCEYLIIGITDCDPERAYFNYSENIKNYNENNLTEPFRSIDNPVFPFTFYERMQMIRLTMLENGIDTKEFDVVPFPVHKPQFIKYYIPLNAPILATIYDDWGRKKVKMFQKMGFKVEILWQRDMSTRFTTGTEVRRRIIVNENWKELVPSSVFNFIKENKLDEILRKIEKK